MKPKSLVRLNLVWIIIFLILFLVILITVNPFKASIYQFIIFYVVFFGLILGILNFIGSRLRIPFWFNLLISIALVFLLILQSYRF